MCRREAFNIDLGSGDVNRARHFSKPRWRHLDGIVTMAQPGQARNDIGQRFDSFIRKIQVPQLGEIPNRIGKFRKIILRHLKLIQGAHCQFLRRNGVEPVDATWKVKAQRKGETHEQWLGHSIHSNYNDIVFESADCQFAIAVANTASKEDQ